MKSLTNLRKGLALVLCAAMLMGDTTMLQASQVESTTVAALMTKSEAEVEDVQAETEDVQAETEEVLTDAEEVIPTEEEVKEADSVAEATEAEEVQQEQEEAEVVEPQAEATEVSEAEEESEESEETQVEAPDVETALSDKALEASYTATVRETTVTVVAPEGAFTEEVTLQVTEVEITDDMQAQLDEQAIAEQKAINSASAYDISFVNAEGKEIEPAKEVQVSIATAEVNSGDDASVYHFDEEQAAVADMEATVVESGDVAFETDHFSTYVIVNKGGSSINVEMHHVDNNGKELCATDNWTLPIGDTVTDYNKAQNWNVKKITKDSANGTEIPKEDLAKLTQSIKVWVHYEPIITTAEGAVTFWDYTVNGTGSSTGSVEYVTYRYPVYVMYYGDNGVTSTSYWFYTSEDARNRREYIYFDQYTESDYYRDNYNVYFRGDLGQEIRKPTLNQVVSEVLADDLSYYEYDREYVEDELVVEDASGVTTSTVTVNCKDNYVMASNPSSDAYLTVGKQDGQVVGDAANLKGRYNKQDINKYAASTAKTGIVRGVSNNGNGEVIFNVNQPGVFVENNDPEHGKTLFKDYKLVFKKTGDTYELDEVKHGDTTVLSGIIANEGKNFFPMDGVVSSLDSDKANNTANGTGGDNKKHNDFFGMRYDVNFQLGDYTGDLTYKFSGDDDLWVVLDGSVVVLDIGGIHQSITKEVNLREVRDANGNLVINPEDKTTTHHLTILYMERGAGESNCSMKFTLPNAQIINHNTPTANLSFEKVDAVDHNVKLSGATFLLEKTDIEGYKRFATSNDKGVVSFEALIEGTYTLRETAAPNGYVPLDKTWTVQVTPAGENEVKATLYDGDKAITEIENTQDKKEEFSKKAKMIQVDGKDTRTYQIDLNANFTTTTTTSVPTPVPTSSNANVVLVLDASSSMKETVRGSYSVVASGNSLKEALNNKDYKGYYVKLDGNYYKINRRKYNEHYNCYYYTVTVDGTEYRFYMDDGLWYYDLSDDSSTTRNFSDDHCVYKQNNRLAVLQEASKNLISKLPDGAKVAIVTFNSKATTVLGMTELTGSSRSTINEKIDKISLSEGTCASYGFRNALNLLDSKEQHNYVVYFTDGYNNDADKEKATDNAGDIKKIATMYAVALLESYNSQKVVDYMNACDSRPTGATLGADISALPDIFSEFAETINEETQQTTVGESGVVVDTVDSRFDLLDKDGNKITKSGTYEIGGKTATVSVGSTTTITWNEKELKDWSVSFQIQAKDDFLGGNMVPTNDPSNSYVVDKEHSFEVPYVNVPLGNITLGNNEETDFLGDVVDTAANGASALLATASVDKPTAAELKAGGTVSKRYSYGGTEFGTLTFSYDTSDGIVGEHELTKKGEAVETYKLKISYTADTPEQRSIEDKDKESYDGAVVTSTTTGADKGIYKVNVVAGKLTINKTISNADYKAAFGDPVFTFKITNDKGKTYFRTLRFSEVKAPAEGENATDVTLTATITDLPSGNYTVKEMPTLGFKLKDLTANGTNAGTVTKNKSAREATFSFGYVKDQTEYAATVNYTNEKKHSPRDTDTDVVKNHFHIENGKVKITPVDAVDNGTTTDTNGREVTNN